MSSEPGSTPNEAWQERAIAAEKKAGELESKLTTISGTLTEAQEALTTLSRVRRIEVELMQADALDIEAARLLTEAALARDPDADIPKVVASLRQRKPLLFRPKRGPISGMSAGAPGGSPLSDIAEQARATGDRRSLLHYLRAKRSA